MERIKLVSPLKRKITFTLQSLEVTTDKRSDLIQLFKDWTEAAAQMTAGNLIGEASSNTNMPPKDTGEAKELSPSNLTITFGVGPTLFSKDGKDRFGLKSKSLLN